MAIVRIAVPSDGNGGLDGQRAGHFGHCDVFTMVDVEDGEIREVSILANKEHVQGGCMVPVQLLADNKVERLIVGGIGMRPLMGFRQVGIDWNMKFLITAPTSMPSREQVYRLGR